MVASVLEAVQASPQGPVDLPTELKDKVWFVKYESQNPMVSDTVHESGWDIQVVADERLGLSEDDGCIITYKGKRRGEIGITPNGDVVQGEEIELREGILDRRIPRFVAWEFRLDSLVKTDGPQRREALQRTYEQQRLEGEKNLLNVLAEAFQKGTSPMGAPGRVDPADLNKYLMSLDPAQRQALLINSEPDEDEGEPEQTNLLAGAPKKGK